MSSTDNIKKRSTGPKMMVTGLLAGLLTLVCTHASAALVTSRAELGGTDFIDWGPLGADSDQQSSPVPIASNLGVNATVSNPNGELWTLVEGGANSGYTGNFALGDGLLSTFLTLGPITIDFASGQSRVGAQIQSIAFDGFTGVISVYDVSNGLLESHTLSGNSNGNQDNTAIFLGVSRATADILRVVFDITGSADDGLGFAINQVDLSSSGAPPVPLPAAAWLLLSGLGGLGLLRRRRTAG
jgi:hypothetical protein